VLTENRKTLSTLSILRSMYGNAAQSALMGQIKGSSCCSCRLVLCSVGSACVSRFPGRFRSVVGQGALKLEGSLGERLPGLAQRPGAKGGLRWLFWPRWQLVCG